MVYRGAPRTSVGCCGTALKLHLHTHAPPGRLHTPPATLWGEAPCQPADPGEVHKVAKSRQLRQPLRKGVERARPAPHAHLTHRRRLPFLAQAKTYTLRMSLGDQELEGGPFTLLIEPQRPSASNTFIELPIAYAWVGQPSMITVCTQSFASRMRDAQGLRPLRLLQRSPNRGVRVVFVDGAGPKLDSAVDPQRDWRGNPPTGSCPQAGLSSPPPPARKGPVRPEGLWESPRVAKDPLPRGPTRPR